jgi:activator of the mannose operon (transcriptional antiterminator)
MKHKKEKIYMKQILKCIKDGEIVSTHFIAKTVGLSEKSVRNKITELNDYLMQGNLGEIQKKPRVGVWLEATEEQKLRLTMEINQDEITTVNYEPEERMYETLKILFRLRPWEAKTSQKIADQLYLSIPTMLKVMKGCEDWLKVYKIKIVNERNKGYRLECHENEYRVALKNLIMGNGVVEEIRKNLNYFFPNMDVSLVSKTIIKTENEWNYRFTDDSFYEILIYCCLAYMRKDYNIPLHYKEEEVKLLQKYNEYPFTVAIFEKLEEMFHVKFSKEDILFLSIQIMCSKFIDMSEVDITLELVEKYDNKLVEFVDKLLNIIGNILEIDLKSDEKLKESLILHLRPTIFRIQYGTTQNNSLINFIKSEYKNVFRASWAISILFDEYYHLKVTEDEIGYIVLYIQAAIEREKHQYKVLLLTNSNKGYVQLIREKVRKVIPEIGELEFVSTHEYKTEKYNDFDIIISEKTIDEQNEKVAVIPDVLSDRGLLKLRNYMDAFNVNVPETGNAFSPECCLLFSPELIFTNVKVKNKDELLKQMSDTMEIKGFVTSKFHGSVVERESKTTTAIGNGVSLPHGSPEEVVESKVAIAILDEPVMWDDEKVEIVFLLGFKLKMPDEIHRIQLFYKEYVSLVETDEKVTKLKAMKSNVEVYKYLIQ